MLLTSLLDFELSRSAAISSAKLWSWTTLTISNSASCSLDTDSFLNALRFVATRGQLEEIRSDNGTNFVGRNQELRKAVKEWNQNKISRFLTQQGIKWIFNTPKASHHERVWGRCIRTVRKVLNALMKEQVLNDERLITQFCEVEAIINGRPITKVSDDHKDLEALTPNHLLLRLFLSKVETSAIPCGYLLQTMEQGVSTVPATMTALV